jgi:hypothetical protein
VDYLKKQQQPADSTQGEIKAWHTHEDSFKFLLNTTDDDVPICIWGDCFFLYSAIVPLEKLRGDYVSDLLGWNFSASSGYGYGYSSSGQAIKPFLYEPMDGTSSQILNGATPVFFLRDNLYDHEEVEINQRISHILGLYWVGKKSAWCRLNDRGEIVERARLVQEDDITYCTLLKDDLDFYLFISNSCLIRVFDVYRPADVGDAFSEPRTSKQYKNTEKEVYADHTLYDDKGCPIASTLRGFQIIRCSQPREQMLRKLQGKEPRRYESFIIWDWKNRQVKEWSSDPQKLGNYFVKTDLPFSTSPAFFKPDVLLQYRGDPSRYIIGQRGIQCKGAWSLPYDINEEGQVFVYIYKLSYLPYEDQLHWKAYNENPKGGISKRAFTTDFEGKWDLSYDPLVSLKKQLMSFPQKDNNGNEVSVWNMPSVRVTRDINFLQYVVTESQKEWEEQIQALAQIVIEGLSDSYINKLAVARGCRDKDLKSGKQLAKIMENARIPKDEVALLTNPLAELWDWRRKLCHPNKEVPSGDLRKHFRDLVQRCDKTMRCLAEFVEVGLFSLPSDSR